MNSYLLKKFNQIERFHWWWQGRQQLVKDLIPKKKNLKIIDIGCGTGETLVFLKKHLGKVNLTGVDFHPDAVKYAKKRGVGNIKLLNAEKLPLKDNAFDYVLFLDVIEHIEDDLKALKEAKRIIKTGGSIVITVPALQFLWSEHDTAQNHYRRYNRRRFHYLAEKLGMKITFMSYFNFFLSPIIIAIRLLSRLSPFKSLGSYNSDLNYNIANKRFINQILTTLFVTEIKLLKFIRYPIGISIGVKLTK